MKVGPNPQTNNFSSFGRPESMKEAVDKAQTKKEEPKEQKAPMPPESERAPEKEEKKPLDATLRARAIFDELGVDFTSEDFQQLIFKGYIEKDIEITKVNGTPLMARIKTLTTREYEYADELMVDDVKNVPMTDAVYGSRRSILNISFAVTHLQGRPLAKPVLEEKTNLVDLKETALARREAFREMHTSMVNLLIEKYTALTVAVSAVVRDPTELEKN